MQGEPENVNNIHFQSNFKKWAKKIEKIEKFKF